MKLNSQSSTLNLFLINQLEKQESNMKFYQSHTIKGTMHRPSDLSPNGGWLYSNLLKNAQINDQPPNERKTNKFANTSINRNVKEFLKLNDLPDSRNPLNDHSLFESSPILFEGWINANCKSYYDVNRRRNPPFDNYIHFDKFEKILSVCGFDPDSHLCLDREGRILDGSYRMYVAGQLRSKGYPISVYVKQYDFE